VDIGILVAFLASKVGQFVICKVYDLISDIKFITVSSRWYIDAIGISFPPTIENFTMEVPMNFIITITCLEDCVAA
jgi:hypothetical protein